MNLQKLKLSDFKSARELALPIVDESNNTIANMVPIGSWALNDDYLLSEFSRWRQIFMRFFLTQFKASVESTKGYLENLSIRQSDRIFFAIYANDRLIGHIGLSNVSTSEAELDNIIRGQSGEHSDLMYFAEKALLNWAYTTLNVENIVAQVMSKNFLAMTLHQRFGFTLKEKHPLKKELDGDYIRYVPCESNASTEKFSLDIIELHRDVYSLI